jgi:hypothetical protein
MYKIVNSQIIHTPARLDVPQPGALVARAGNEESAVPRKVERVDFLHVALEQVADALFLNVPYLVKRQHMIPFYQSDWISPLP